MGVVRWGNTMEGQAVGAIGTVAIIVIVSFIILYLSVRVVRQDERLVIFRLGRTGPMLLREPGLRFIIPFIDRPVRVDMREQVVEVASRSCATRDEQLVDIDARIAYRIVDPLKMVLAVRDVNGSLAARALDILGALVAESTGEDVRFRREALAGGLRDRLDDEVEDWGAEVTVVSLT